MKVENDDYNNSASENGWFVFGADSYGVVRVYCVKKGQIKYSLYTSMISEDKTEILKMKYL